MHSSPMHESIFYTNISNMIIQGILTKNVQERQKDFCDVDMAW